jgi:ribulose-5-phosphate 4-epimerase/fuculose-1-phosphate aldolase
MSLSIKTNLSAAYKILAKLDMADHTYTHLSSRPDGADYYYIHPFGLRFEEVTANNLLKVSLDGKILEGAEYQYNETGYIIHGSIYKARADLNSIIHLHTVPTVAVSCMKEGLMPISQWALHFYNQVHYHDYNSLALDNETQGKDLANDLSDRKIMFLRNHGIITTGKTMQEAFFYCYHLELACKTQIAALSTGAELVIPSKEICLKANHDLLNFEQDLGARDWQAWLRFIEKG